MFRACLNNFPRQFSFLAFATMAATLMVLAPATTRAQRSKGATDGGDDMHPAFSDFKGVRIGMMADEARKKLGSPQDKGADQDFYIFNDNENAQVFYDKGGTVNAISVNYLSGAHTIPTCKDVFGIDAEAKADGAVYKMVRYPKAGYWVAYSKTAGNDALVTITIQKIQ